MAEKLMKKILSLCFMAMMVFSFVACEEDGGGGGNGSSNNITTSLVGTTWKYSVDNDSYYFVLNFNTSTNGILHEVGEDGDYQQSFTYSYQDGYGTIYVPSDGESVPFHVDGRYLYIDMSGAIGPFVRQ